MKQFEELNEKERKSKSQVDIRKHINKKTITMSIICTICAILLALVWTSIYTAIQKRRLIRMQQENVSTNYTISFNVDDVSFTENSTNNADDVIIESSYEDISIEFIGADKKNSSSNDLQLYLKVINPNAEALDIRTTAIYFNDICVQDKKYVKSIDGNKETIVKFYVEYPKIIETQVGETITNVSIQYNFNGENNNMRECSDSEFSYKIGDDSPTRIDSMAQTNNIIENETQTEEKVDIYGTLDGNISDKLKIKFSNIEEKNSYVAFVFLIENEIEEDFGVDFWYESNVNDYTLTMRGTSEISSKIVPAGGSAIMTLKYSANELQYCGISIVENLRFYVGETGTDRTDATEVTFKDLGIKINESAITENAINNRISGELSVGEMSKGISIDYVGYETTSSYICLYFDVTNTSDKYYGFAFWYASQVNKCALKMKSTSEISGALDGNDHVLLAVKYALDDLKNAGIGSIGEVIFSFADNMNNKANAATAIFYDLDIPVD